VLDCIGSTQSKVVCAYPLLIGKLEHTTCPGIDSDDDIRRKCFFDSGMIKTLPDVIPKATTASVELLLENGVTPSEKLRGKG